MVWKQIVSCFGKIVFDEELEDVGDVFGGDNEGGDDGDGGVDEPTVDHVEEEEPQPATEEGNTELEGTTTDGLGDTGGLLNE